MEKIGFRPPNTGRVEVPLPQPLADPYGIPTMVPITMEDLLKAGGKVKKVSITKYLFYALAVGNALLGLGNLALGHDYYNFEMFALIFLVLGLNES